MWLIAKKIDKLLAANKINRSGLAKELDCSLGRLNQIFDGKEEADEELSRLIIAALGADEMRAVINWQRMAA